MSRHARAADLRYLAALQRSRKPPIGPVGVPMPATTLRGAMDHTCAGCGYIDCACHRKPAAPPESAADRAADGWTSDDEDARACGVTEVWKHLGGAVVWKTHHSTSWSAAKSGCDIAFGCCYATRELAMAAALAGER